jgi:glycyl-tRNA synthetase beta chain
MAASKTASALLEIGTESLPARFLRPTLKQLEEKVTALLGEQRLSFTSIETHGTPMRLALLVHGIPAKSTTEELEVTGPPARLLKDDAGKFTKQAEGFARKNGVSPDELGVKKLPKGEFLFVQKTLEGEPAIDVLSEVFLTLIKSLEFPKSMVWEESRFRFARPIRTLCALYGPKKVPLTIAGIKSDDKVRGLAATGAKPLRIATPEKYVGVLQDACVLVDIEVRRKTLLKSLEAAAKRASGSLDADEELIEKIVCFTEHPVAVLGHFEKEHLELPQQLLNTVLKQQLMFFPVCNSTGGLEADFIGVRDGISEGQKIVQTGFERVLAARLADARFFFGRDKQTKLEDRVPALERVGFQKGLGNLGDKTARVVSLAAWIGEQLLQDHEIDMPAVKQAAGLAYADLQAGVVGEFPELQGVMGGVYARHEGLDERVALAIEEFHNPTAANGSLPTGLEGCIVALAGKLDSICMMFSGGFIPSGSEDPFALRRMGNGVIRIVLERQIPLSLPAAIKRALELAGSFPSREFDTTKTTNEVSDFMWQRLESLFLERNFPIDVVRAVREGALDSVAKTFKRMAAVQALRPEPDFVPLAATFKRAANILKKEANGGTHDIDKDLLHEEAEQKLFGALCRVEGEVLEKVSQGDYEDGLRSLVGLKPEVDNFFENVMVMDKDDKVKANRLSLLSRLVRLFKTVADISHIQN